MGFLVVTCRACGQKYTLHGDMVLSTSANICPSCSAEIQRSFWDSHIVPAWAAFEDANRDLENIHTGYDNAPLFEIEYKASRRRKT